MNHFDQAWLDDYQARHARQPVGVAEPQRPAPVQHEWKGQETVAAFLDLALPEDAWWTSIDTGSARSRAVGGLRKKRGIKPGTPDTLIVWNGITLWVELKHKYGKLSAVQQAVRLRLLANGHNYALARTLDDVIDACTTAGIPLKATAL